MHRRVAVLVDGGFFFKRMRSLYEGKHYATPEAAARTLQKLTMAHVGKDELYRIFYYDCPPLSKKVHNPVTNAAVDFAKTDVYQFMAPYFECLKKTRKLALRTGYLDEDNAHWELKPRLVKPVVTGQLDVATLTESSVKYTARQKGVDMMIGVDIATLALKRLVGKIVLIAGDSDFVPAAKLARREGVDFVLDPMWNPIKPDLHEHIDGLKCWSPNPRKKVKK